MIAAMRNCPQHFGGAGYLAGTDEGIVTAGGTPAVRRVYLYYNHRLIRETTSNAEGHYAFLCLDPQREYLIMARDWMRHYEPVAYDNVRPATNITPQEQWRLWQSWRTTQP